jgi:hypothetical protein
LITEVKMMKEAAEVEIHCRDKIPKEKLKKAKERFKQLLSRN